MLWYCMLHIIATCLGHGLEKSDTHIVCLGAVSAPDTQVKEGCWLTICNCWSWYNRVICWGFIGEVKSAGFRPMFFAANCKSCAWTWREGKNWEVQTEDDKLVTANQNYWTRAASGKVGRVINVSVKRKIEEKWPDRAATISFFFSKQQFFYSECLCTT